MGGLSFSDRARRSMWRMVPKRAVSDAIGWGVSLGIPAALRTLMLSRFARIYGIDVSEAEKPLAEYAGFDEFFTRKLRPGARPIDDGARPRRFARRRHRRRVRAGDGGQAASGQGQPLRPRRPCSTTPQAAARLRGRRLPHHLPFAQGLPPRAFARRRAGSIGWRHVPGTLFSVGAASIRREPGPVRPQRTLRHADRDGRRRAGRGRHGRGGRRRPRDRLVRSRGRDAPAGVLPRRAFATASTTQPKPIRRGDELGIFHLGSTTIVVFEPGRVELDALAAGASVKMGVGIGRVGVNDRESPRLKPGVEGPRRLFAHIERPHARGAKAVARR